MAAKDIHLYNVPLTNPSSIHLAVGGNFSSPNSYDIVLSRGGTHIELLSLNNNTGQLISISIAPIYGQIRSLQPFRFHGSLIDYLIVSSDSGHIVILSYNCELSQWQQIKDEIYGKSGCRRIVAGEYLAADPAGRAVMIAAIEKQKLVYILNRDAEAKLIIQSPLDCSKNCIINYSIVGLHVDFDNPLFAALESDYSIESSNPSLHQLAPKQLSFYELDLNLNTVTKKYSELINSTANLLIPVPYKLEDQVVGPGGLLICNENFIQYKHKDYQGNKPIISTPLPRRYGIDAIDKGILIVSHSVLVRPGGILMFLLQSEHGDLYKLTLHSKQGNIDMKITYFDTIAVSNSLVITPTGFLFSASEAANSYLFQLIPDSGTKSTEVDVFTDSSTQLDQLVQFQPQKLRHLRLLQELESISPILDMKVADLTKEGSNQIYLLSGKSTRSALNVLRLGLSVSEIAESEVPGTPTAVWSLKQRVSDQFASYIVISFIDATVVLSVGETATEVSDSGIAENYSTLQVQALADNSWLQVHSGGIRHIGTNKAIREWKAPSKKLISAVASNERQCVIALSAGELIYFELNPENGQFEEKKSYQREMGNDISALALSSIESGKVRASFLAVGMLDSTVRLLSLDPTQPMVQLSLQIMADKPNSLLIQSLAANNSTSEYLFIGLNDGVLLRSQLDSTTGQFLDSRKKFLGTKPIKLQKVTVNNGPAVLALSSRSWLTYSWQNSLHIQPIAYDSADSAAFFASSQCAEGIIMTAANTLKVVSIDKIGELFHKHSVPLRYTPRKMVSHPQNNHLCIIEADNNSYSYKMAAELKAALAIDEEELKTGPNLASPSTENEPSEQMIGSAQAGEGNWGSCIRIINPNFRDLPSVCVVELEDNEAAFSLCCAQLDPVANDWYLCVGTVKDYKISPRQITCGFIHVYKFILTTEKQVSLQFLHKTSVNDVVLALQPFNRKLLAGVGKTLRLYELGKKKLLVKSQNNNIPTVIQSIGIIGSRIFLGSIGSGFHLVEYFPARKELFLFADQQIIRFLTANSIVDYDTVAGGDKFGNIFLTRLPSNISEQLSNTNNTNHTNPNLTINSNPKANLFKMCDIANFHVGATVTSIFKCSLITTAANTINTNNDILLYATITGQLNALIPLVSREDVEFFTHFQLNLRGQLSALSGRDHLSYRSTYFPVKNIIDGELIQEFNLLSFDQSNALAAELSSTPQDIKKKLEEIKNRII
jgi:splicing factor 3B subunit 3